MGADLGGNATIVGASANVIVVNLARAAGYPISFMLFFRYGAVITVLTLIAVHGVPVAALLLVGAADDPTPCEYD